MDVEKLNAQPIEDNPGDVRLIMEAFKNAKVYNNIQVQMDGESAVQFLLKQGEYKDAPRPDLILLDLNLPKKDGREVLAEINEDPNLKHIPVVILTTSRAEEDIMKAYEHHAIFITKPIELDKFFEEVKKIEEFWLSLVKLSSEKQN